MHRKCQFEEFIFFTFCSLSRLPSRFYVFNVIVIKTHIMRFHIAASNALVTVVNTFRTANVFFVVVDKCALKSIRSSHISRFVLKLLIHGCAAKMSPSRGFNVVQQHSAPPGGKQASGICCGRRITVDVYDSWSAFEATSWQHTVGVLRAQTALNPEKRPKEKKESSFYNR